MLSERSAYFDRLRSELHLGDADDDVLRELADHVDDAIEQMVGDGLTTAQATADVFRGLGRAQTLAHLLRQAHFITRWHEALLGGTPMVLVAALIGLRLWQVPAVAAGAAVVIVSMTLYGLWRGRPAWFYPWAGVALTFPLIVGYVAFVLLQDASHAHNGTDISLPLAGIAASLLYYPVGLVVVSGAVLIAVRRDWLDASILLSPLPIALVWIVTVHRAGGLLHADDSLAATSQLLGMMCIGTALTTVAILGSSTRALKVTLMVCGSVLMLAAGDMAASASMTPVVTVARIGLLVSFLLSPALVARRVGSV